MFTIMRYAEYCGVNLVAGTVIGCFQMFENHVANRDRETPPRQGSEPIGPSDRCETSFCIDSNDSASSC